MTFRREKRQLIGWLALLAPVPLPFNEVLEWPVLALYAVLVALYLERAERDARTWLPNWALNLLGLAYLPILAFDLQLAIARGQLIRMLLHLLLFLLVVKLYSMRREKEKWQVLIAIFFVFVGAMATSSHLTISIYLLAFSALGLHVLARLAHLHAVGGFKRPDPAAARLPVRAPVAACMLAISLLAVPLFALMPRLREPIILGRGTGTGALIASTGFSDSVDLSLTTSIRSNREVVLRIQYDEPGDRRSQMRLKGRTYDLYRDRSWHSLRDGRWSRRIGRDAQALVLAPGEPTASAHFFLEPIESQSLILPVETLRVDLERTPMLELDPGGAVSLPAAPRSTLSYRVEVADEPVIAALGAGNPESPVSGLDPGGVSERMRQLAAEVMGEGSPEEKVDRLEQHLLTQYGYTLNFVGRDGERPLEDFLFVYKSGHCEYFASAMVLMLRSQGIPARLATGFLGAEHNPLEGYYIVRQQNAHAWVEAHTPERGWRVYDPTPPEGRPGLAERDLLLMVSQLYDYLLFRWDRYVLSFGAEDQVSFFQGLQRRLAELWKALAFWEEAEEAAPEAPSAAPGEAPSADGTTRAAAEGWRLPGLLLWLAGAAVTAALAGALYRRRTALLSAGAAYRRLRRLLEGSGLGVTASTAPLALERMAVASYPGAAAAARRVVRLYLRESFAGSELSRDERLGLRAALDELGESIERSRRRKKI